MASRPIFVFPPRSTAGAAEGVHFEIQQPYQMLTPPTGWEEVAATLAELRASYGQMAAFIHRQWCELDSLLNELAERQRRLDARERELARREEHVACS